MIAEAVVGAVTLITLGSLVLANAVDKRAHVREVGPEVWIEPFVRPLLGVPCPLCGTLSDNTKNWGPRAPDACMKGDKCPGYPAAPARDVWLLQRHLASRGEGLRGGPKVTHEHPRPAGACGRTSTTGIGQGVRLMLPLRVRGAIAFCRQAFRNDGAEGESVHLLCDALEERDQISVGAAKETTDREVMRATLLAYGWQETLYGTFLAPGVEPPGGKVWRIQEAYARVVGHP